MILPPHISLVWHRESPDYSAAVPQQDVQFPVFAPAWVGYPALQLARADADSGCLSRSFCVPGNSSPAPRSLHPAARGQPPVLVNVRYRQEILRRLPLLEWRRGRERHRSAVFLQRQDFAARLVATTRTESFVPRQDGPGNCSHGGLASVIVAQDSVASSFPDYIASLQCKRQLDQGPAASQPSPQQSSGQ